MAFVLLQCVPPTGQGSILLQVPVQYSYQQYLELLSQELGVPTQSFEYEDDEKDRITVTSDVDLHHMLTYYGWLQSQQRGALTIFPVTGSAKRRNVLGLKIDVEMPAAASADGGSPGLQSAVETAPLQIKDHELQLLDLLGHGSAGTVYKALHGPTQQIMAVKVIPLDATMEEQNKIMTELEILHRCHSQHVIGYYGAFFSENRIKICTEYMDGGSLAMYGQIPEGILGPIVVSVLSGLQYLSASKVMHRDIKPSNILVNSSGAVKLCDFGVSAQLEQSITKTFVGTNAYMAPERIMAQPYNVRSEVWSLGVTLVELAIGRFPYPTTEQHRLVARPLLPIELLQCIVNEPPPALPAEHFSPPFVDFVARTLVKQADLRPLPSELLLHPFVQLHRGREADMCAWVRLVLSQR